MRALFATSCLAIMVLGAPSSAATLTFEKLFGSPISQVVPDPAPQEVTAPAGDSNRLFFVDRVKGQVSIYDRNTKTISATPFLSLPPSEFTNGVKYGAFSLAFHPKFGASSDPVNKVYISFVDNNQQLRVAEYTVNGANPNQVDASSYRDIITVPYAPTSPAIHYAGDLDFDKDGYLYLTTGDKTADQQVRDVRSQDLNSLEGKILKLDVSGDAFAGDLRNNFKPAPDNIIQDPANLKVTDAIWAIGARNPYQASYDKVTGTYYIGDVGEDVKDEINIGRSHANYGWPALEGDQPAGYPWSVPLNADPGLIPTGPLYMMSHGVDGTGDFEGQAIVGGLVYRGGLSPLDGLYFFGDFSYYQGTANKIWSFRPDPVTGTYSDLRLWSLQALLPGAELPNGIVSFGQDGDGNLYVVALNGLFRLAGTDLVGTPSPVPIPAAGLLLASAIGAGSIASRRVRRKRTNTQLVPSSSRNNSISSH